MPEQGAVKVGVEPAPGGVGAPAAGAGDVPAVAAVGAAGGVKSVAGPAVGGGAGGVPQPLQVGAAPVDA